MNQKVYFVFLSLLLSFTSLAQEKTLDPYGRDLDALTLNKRGPNSDKYSHLFIGFGFVTGFDLDNSEIIYGKSGNFTLGYLFKWRLARYLESGFDVAYHRTAYHLQQDSAKTLPTPDLHDREKIVFNALQVSPFVRIKLRNRFHSNGTFVDLGGFAGWQYNVKHETVESNNNLQKGAGKTRIVNTNLSYTRDYSYGLLTRFGFNRFIIYGRYRITNIFNDNSNFDDLPQYEVGLKIGIHQ